MSLRVRDIINLGSKVALHESELSDMAYSHSQLTQAAFDRVEVIRKGELNNHYHRYFDFSANYVTQISVWSMAFPRQRQ